MRNFKKLLFTIFCMSLCFACTEPDGFLGDTPAMLKAGKIKVMPSTATDALTKAQEDWQNINEALQNAGPGEVVQLAEGLFYLHKSVIRWDFNGTLKGSGINETTIQTVPGELFDVSECPPLNFTFKNTDGFYMFCFAHHYNKEMRTVAVSDLTIIVDEPTTPYYQYRPGEDPEEGNSIQALHVQYENLDKNLAEPINLNVIYKNISVIGEKDVTYLNHGYSLYAGLAAFGASSGNFEAKNVNVENAYLAIIPNVFNGENSTVTVKNSQVNNTRNGISSFFSRCWIILNSEFENSFASIVLNKYRGGVDVELPTGNSFIRNNRINVTNGVAVAGYDMENTEVKNNVFYGSGYTGIWTLRCNTWSITNNDLCDITNPFSGNTITLNAPMNFEVNNNSNQTVGGTIPFDPSNIIGEGRECD